MQLKIFLSITNHFCITSTQPRSLLRTTFEENPFRELRAIIVLYLTLKSRNRHIVPRFYYEHMRRT